MALQYMALVALINTSLSLLGLQFSPLNECSTRLGKCIVSSNAWGGAIWRSRAQAHVTH